MKCSTDRCKIVIVIFLSLLVTGCFENNNGNTSAKQNNFKMEFEIIPSIENAYVVYLPVPVNGYANWVVKEEGKPIDYLKYLEISEGNGTFKIIEANSEYFLNINSSGYIKIVFNFDKAENKLPLPFDTLSSSKIFLNTTESNQTIINYFIEFRDISNHYTWSLDHYYAKNGWQDVEINEELIIYD